MFVVFLRFSENKSQAGAFMAGHNAWLKRGFDDGSFLVSGSLGTGDGGALIASMSSRDEIEQRLQDDPFVAADVVRPEIHEIAPSRSVDALSFLLT
jgi:uncharacterized protein YciI